MEPSILARIDDPQDLRGLDIPSLAKLAEEIRALIVKP